MWKPNGAFMEVRTEMCHSVSISVRFFLGTILKVCHFQCEISSKGLRPHRKNSSEKLRYKAVHFKTLQCPITGKMCH